MNQPIDQKIKLAPPGAGIGFFTELFLKVYVNPFVTKKATWESCETSFKKLHSLILKELESIPVDKAELRILVPPQKGLEDSSRYWSVKMLVEHLLIVGTQGQTAIIRLSKEEHMSELVSTADVKPLGEASYSLILDKFRNFSASLPDDLSSRVVNKESRSTLKHPWFGAFNSKQWYWLLGMHASIHLHQLKEIKKGLNL